MKAIVVGYDGSQTAARAVHEAGQLAATFRADLHIVAVVDDHAVRHGMISAAEQDAAIEQARAATELLVATSTSEGGLAETVAAITTKNEVRTGDPSRCLLDYAATVDADLIVVGNRRTQGVSRLLGSVAVDVLRQTNCSVYVAHTA